MEKSLCKPPENQERESYKQNFVSMLSSLKMALDEKDKLPFSLVLCNYMYGLWTPLKIPPFIHISIVMEKNNREIRWKKL